MPQDREIWDRICKADVRAFEEFYQANARRLERFLRQMVGNQQAAEDIAQETFTLLWRKPNGFQPQRGSLRAYLYGIARKRAAEWWRRRTPETTEIVETPGNSPTETCSAIQDALRRLPEGQRSLLWLREVEGRSYEELAAILDIPLGTVRSRLYAAREALRKIWHAQPARPKEGA